MIKKILIAIDNTHRELSYCKVISDRIHGNESRVIFCSMYSLDLAFQNCLPNILILPKVHKVIRLKEYHEIATIIYLPAEMYSGSKDGFITTISHELNQLKYIDYRICWGDFDFSILNDLYDDKFRLIHFGHPAIEYWMLKKNASHMNTVGIISTTRVLNNKNSSNLLSGIISVEYNNDNDGNSIFFKKGDHAEAWLAYELAFYRILINLIRENPDTQFIIRPHPSERNEIYLFLERKFSNVIISKRGESFSDYLNSVDTVLGHLSVGLIESFLRGKLVFSLKNLFPNWVLDKLPDRLILFFDDKFPALDSFNLDHLQKISKSSNELILLSKLYFNFPLEGSPSNDMAKLIENIKVKKLSCSQFESQGLRRFLKFKNAHVLLDLYYKISRRLKGFDSSSHFWRLE